MHRIVASVITDANPAHERRFMVGTAELGRMAP